MLTDSQFQTFLRAEADRRNLSRAEREAFLRALSGDDITTIATRLQVRPEAIRQRLSQVYQKFEIGGKGPVKLAKLQQRLQMRYQEQRSEDRTAPIAVKRQQRERPRWDWGEAPDVAKFYGRDAELSDLQRWIVEDKCRLVALLGFGGIGKTALARKLVEQIQEGGNFDRLIWRSLRGAPKLDELLDDLLPVFSNDDFPADTEGKLARLLEDLRQSGCLIVLDDVEEILQPGNRFGCYQPGYENYGQFLQRIGEFTHQSCAIVLSRETIREIELYASPEQRIRCLKMKGLLSQDAQKILEEKELSGTPTQIETLIQRVGSNPLHLKFVSAKIENTFAGSIELFTKYATSVSSGGTGLLDLEEQTKRLSDEEWEVLIDLAEKKAPASIEDLIQDFSSFTPSDLIKYLNALVGRFMVEKNRNEGGKKAGEVRFSIQPFLKSYITKKNWNQLKTEVGSY
jgi:predicted transcriptional regulator/DNA-binding CsgD family transcriptional regulator